MFCKCGCGKLANSGRRFIKGHSARLQSVREKISKKAVDRWSSDEFKQNARKSMRGKEHILSEEGREKLIQTGKSKVGLKNPFFGKKHTSELKEILSIQAKMRMGSKNPFFGKKHTQDTKLQISIKNKGREVTEERRKKISDKSKQLWSSLEYRDKVIKATFEALNNRRPTSFEQKIINLCKEYDLPFSYVGDGKVIISYVNPDFISTDGSNCIIETYYSGLKQENYRELRSKRFKSVGYRTLFLDEIDLCNKLWFITCMEKISSFIR